MQQEREYLRKRIFPELRAQAQDRRADFAPVDLQWVSYGAKCQGCLIPEELGSVQGVAKDEVAAGKVISNCLHYISASRDHGTLLTHLSNNNVMTSA